MALYDNIRIRMTASGTGYNWTNTSQWSQVPTVPMDQSSPQPSYNQSTPQQGFPQNNYQNSFQNQESRKDMVSRLYRTILGREADIAGLNYYLYNTQLTEPQIAKEMFESTEHVDLVSKAKDIREMIKKTEETQKKMSEMEFTLQSLQTLNVNYKNLLEQKTQIINQMRSHLSADGYNIPEISPFTPANQAEQTHQPVQSQNVNDNEDQTIYYESPNDYAEVIQETDSNDYLIQDPFDDEQGKAGCFGWIKSWFKFV